MDILELAADHRAYLTASQAAEVFGVSADAVRRWVRVGYLAPVVSSGQGPAVYEFNAVAEAEKRARDAAIATSGSDKRVRRNF